MSDDSFIQVLSVLLQARWQQVATAAAAVRFSAEPLQPFVANFGANLLDHMAVAATVDRKRWSLITRAQRADALKRADGVLGPDGWDYPASVSAAIHDAVAELMPARLEVRATLSHQYERPELSVDLEGLWGREAVLPLLQRLVPAALESYEGALVYLGVREVRAVRLSFNPVTGEPLVTVWFHRVYSSDDNAKVISELDAVAELLGVAESQRRFLSDLHGHFTPRPTNDTPIALTLATDEILPRLDVTYRAIPTRLVLGVLQGVSSRSDHGAVLGTVAGALLTEAPGAERLTLTWWNQEPPGVEWELVSPPEQG